MFFNESFLKNIYLFYFLLHWVLVVARGLFIAEHRHSFPIAYGIFVPRPGIEPTSPALEGGFLTTGLPGKSQDIFSCYTYTQR